MVNIFFPLHLIHRFSTVSPVGSPTTINLDVDLDLSNQARQIFDPVSISNVLCSTAVLHGTPVCPNPMADHGSWLMSSKLIDAILTRDLVLCLVKGTVNDQFSNDEEAAAAERRIFQSTALKCMLVYGVEHTKDGGPCDKNIEKFIVEGATNLPTSHLSSVVVKITAICPMSLLKRVSDLLRWQYKNKFPVFSGLSHLDHTTSEPEPLTVVEEEELEKAHQRLKSITQICQESNVPLLIESEETILQPAIDYIRSAIMFNHTTSEPEALTVEEEQEPEKAHERMRSSCLPPPASSLNQQSNSFLNVAPPHPPNLANHVPDPYHMDTLSWTALGYCFAASLEFNAIFAQVANPNNVSFRVQLLSLLLNVALCLLIAANAIFAKTRPKMVFLMDRVGSAIVLISTSIAAMPTIPEYVSIGIAVFLMIVYVHQHFAS